ncbi:MAG TPA: cytochrome c oxidase assembly protein [Gammaproteobacteria bacterium]|nr:cytochrome c oxidase assembly protein [Gammaproteobacteria bacterium]
MRRLTSFAVIAISAAAPAAAHGVGAAEGLHWVWEPWVLLCLAITTIPYVIGLLRMGRDQRARIVGFVRSASFLLGIALLLIALESPLDALADDLFSAHMVQHMLLLLVIPPLLVYGRPVITWLWAFDLRPRRAIVRTWSRLGLYNAFRVLTQPVPIWLLLTAALCFWHLPGPYDWAVCNEWLHDLEHLSFLGLSLAFWTIVIEPYGRRRALSYGASIVYVVSAGFVMALIGAILTFAPHPLYAVHLHTTARYGLTPLQDQELAGVIMWIPSNMIHLAAICTLFFGWMRDDERRAAHFRTMLPGAAMRCVLIVPLLAAVLAACSGQGSSATPFQAIPGASAEHGEALINHYGCGACHTIPGISGADGLVGPPLDHWSRRSFIAGIMRNNPQNLVHWIEHPQQVIPGVDMPDMGVTPEDARDIAAYLYTIN